MSQLLEALNFDPKREPFGSWNAADERDILPSCFIAPPYFETVWGNPKSPSSTVVLAPTGFGKTAQCVMIQERASNASSDYEVIALVYDEFQRQGIQSLKDASLKNHLIAMTRIVLLALLTTIGERQKSHLYFTQKDLEMIAHLSKVYIGSASTETIEVALRSIRTPWQKLSDSLTTAAKSVPLLNIAIKLFSPESSIETLAGLPKAIAAFTSGTPSEGTLTASKSDVQSQWFDFERAVELLSRYYDAVYFLIDRVDEAPFTTKNAEASFKLMEPLLTNLELLNPNSRKWGFKFFLWNGIESLFTQYCRTDRVSIHRVQWRDIEIVEMLDKRVGAYSNRQVGSISDIFSNEVFDKFGKSVEDIITFFSQGSPRDSIRICHEIVNAHLDYLNREELPLSIETAKFSPKSVERGLKQFIELRVNELVPNSNMVRQMQAVGSVTFTSTRISADIFKIERNSATNKINQWINTGVVAQIGEERNKQGGKPKKVYGFTDPRLAYKATNQELGAFLKNKTVKCPHCSEILLRDTDLDLPNGSCTNCSHELPGRNIEESFIITNSVLKDARKELAKNIQDIDLIYLIASDAGISLPEEQRERVSNVEVFWQKVIQEASEMGSETLKSLLTEALDRLDSCENVGAITSLIEDLSHEGYLD